MVNVDGVSLVFHGTPYVVVLNVDNYEYLTVYGNGFSQDGILSLHIGNFGQKSIDYISFINL